MKLIIAITMGDPGGIGPEVILKSLEQIESKKVIPLVIGSSDAFRFASERFQIPFAPHEVPTLERSLLREDTVNFLDMTREAEALYEKAFGKKHLKNEMFSLGEVSEWNGALAYSALKIAAYQAALGLINGIVTAPVNKNAVRLIDPDFSGHTEYLAKIARVKDFAMMFINERLRVTLVTIHVPLRDAARVLKTEDIITKTMLTEEFLRRYFKITRPRIGISALNPHGSEFGTEEEEKIIPAVQKIRVKGIDVKGPLPGDQVFHEAYEGRLDAVIAMYHDQGLAPFKMIAFRDGVNVTLGLPYLRTSPDHGTAFDIAYQGRAEAISFQSAFQLLERLI